jgi:PAS domain S-box-containing protein
MTPNPEAITVTVSAILEALPEALIVTDTHGRILLINQQAEWLFGGSRTNVVGRSVEEFMPERYRAQHAVDREEYVRNPRVRHMGRTDLQLIAQLSGDEVSIDASLSPLMTGSGMLILAMLRRKRDANSRTRKQDKKEAERDAKDNKRP